VRARQAELMILLVRGITWETLAKAAASSAKNHDCREGSQAG
jgi:hypothetical protein